MYSTRSYQISSLESVQSMRNEHFRTAAENMAIKNFCLPVLCRKVHHARWGHSGAAGGTGGPCGLPSLALPEAPPVGPTSGASHLLPECTVVTVVGLGLRSAPTPETPDEEEMKLQSVEGARPAGTVGTRIHNFRRKHSPLLLPGSVRRPNFPTLDSKFYFPTGKHLQCDQSASS